MHDVEGLLAGPGQVVSRGDGARVSVVVLEDWRVQALVDELLSIDVEAELVAGDEQRSAVRTPFLPALLPIARRWTSGAVKLPPAGLQLDGHRLRWWALAAGRCDHGGYALGLGPSDEQAWPGVGAALAAAGVPGTFVGPRGDGPAYRIVGRKRLDRLRELVGSAPPGVLSTAWPPD